MREREGFQFGNRRVGLDSPPLIVAEISANHNGSLERALEIVDAAAEAGAHAVKLQTFTPDTMTLAVSSAGFVVDDPQSPWHGRTLYDLYEEAQTPWAWHEPIFVRARERGLLCFSTPFDASSIAFLERFDPPAYKIASFEITDLALIAAAARTNRNVVLSTGMATVAEIDDAVRTVRANGCGGIVLLKCTSIYPALAADGNLATIPHLRELFGTEVGLSDHAPGVGVAVGAVALGATLVEKHVTLRRADGGPDAGFSLEPEELRALVVETERAWQARGRVRYGPLPVERASLQFRRSLYVAEDMRAGEVFTDRNLRVVRPGFGIEPRFYERVLGRRIAADAKRGTPVTWELLA